LEEIFPKLPNIDMDTLHAPVTNKEIRQVLFSMRNYKALGVDGFQVVFYKSQWEVVGVSFC